MLRSVPRWFLLLLFVALSGAATSALGLLGDVDRDSDVDSDDAQRVLESVVGMTDLDPEVAADADVDGDGDVDTFDAQLIRQFAAGAIGGFPPRLPQNSSHIAVSRDGTLLGVVNPDSDTVSFVAIESLELLVEVPVGREPTQIAFSRDGHLAYVTLARDRTLAVVDTASFVVVDRIPVGVEPFGVAVAFSGRKVVVSNFASATLEIIDTQDPNQVVEVPVAEKPQGIAISADSKKIYVAHLFGGYVSVVDADTLQVDRIPLAEIPFDPDNTTVPAGIANRTKAIALHPTRGEAWLPHILSNSGNFIETLFDSSIFPAVSVIDTLAEEEIVSERMTLAAGLGFLPTSEPEALAFSPDGVTAYVVASASNDLLVIDVATRQLITLVRDVGDNPRGIVVQPDGTRAFIFNRLSPTVTVFDCATRTVVDSVSVSSDPLPSNIANGRRLFFTSALPEVAKDRFVGCEGCHFDGRDDGQVWFFTNGPRQTLSMAGGTLETGLLHHSGDRENVQDFRFTFTRLQNGTGLTEDQLNDLADFVNFGIRHFDNPFLNEDLSRTAAARRGRRIFQQAQCGGCHSGPFLTDATGHIDPANPLLHDVGIFAPGSQGQDQFDKTRDQDAVAAGVVRSAGHFESTFLIGAWATAPYLHDQRSATLMDVLTTDNPGDVHGITSNLAPEELDDLVAYMLQADITNARVRIDYPADGTRVARLSEVRGEILDEVVAVEVWVNGAGPYAATIEDGTFVATVAAPALADGMAFDITARATTADGEPGRDDVEAVANFGVAVNSESTTIEVEPDRLVANGISEARVTVRPLGTDGELAGAGLNVGVNTDLGSVGPVSDLGDGTYEAVFTSGTVAGEATIGASLESVDPNAPAGGLPFTAVASVTLDAGDVDPDVSQVSVVPVLLEASGIAVADVIVVPRDAFGNLLASGAVVSVVADVGAVGAAVDQGDGSFVARYTAPTTVGVATLGAVVNGVPLTSTPAVTLVADITRPVPGNLERITFTAPEGGISRATGGPGAVEPLASVILSNSESSATVTVTASSDGSFVADLPVGPNEEVCIEVRDIAGNLSVLVCTVPFVVEVKSVRGTVVGRLAGGGCGPIPGAIVELDIANFTDPCAGGFSSVLGPGGGLLTDITGPDGSFEIQLPTGFVPDADLAIVTGPDDDEDGVIDVVDLFGVINDITRDSILVDTVSTLSQALICYNGVLRCTNPPACTQPPAFPYANYCPDERLAIENAVRAASDVSCQSLDPLGDIDVDIFRAPNPDAADQLAINALVQAGQSARTCAEPRILEGVLTVPSASGDVPVPGAFVDLVSYAFGDEFPFDIAVIPGSSAVTDDEGHYRLRVPGAVDCGAAIGVVAVGDLEYGPTGQAGTFDPYAEDFSGIVAAVAGFTTDRACGTDAPLDMPGRIAMSLLPIPGVPIENFSGAEIAELMGLLREKFALLSLSFANRLLSEVYDDAFNQLAADSDVQALLTDIADAEPTSCNVIIESTSVEADGHSAVAITVEPFNELAEPLGPGRVLEVFTTLGEIANPAIDNLDGTYTALLDVPVAEGEARIRADIEGSDCGFARTITFVPDTTPPPDPDLSRIVVTSIGATTTTVFGLPGSVEPQSRVRVTNLSTGRTILADASPLGGFRLDLIAAPGERLRFESVDGWENSSAAVEFEVTAGFTLPAIVNTAAVPTGVVPGLRSIGVAESGTAVPPGYQFLGGFALDLEGATALAPLDVVFAASSTVSAGKHLLLVQVINVLETPALRVVARAVDRGGLLAPVNGPGFPGIRDSGMYAVLAADDPLSFVAGAVSGAGGSPIRDALVQADPSPFVDLTRDDGAYLLAGAVGPDRMIRAQVFAHEAPEEVAIRFPYAGAILVANFDFATRATRSYAFTGRFLHFSNRPGVLAVEPGGATLFAVLAQTGDFAIVDTDSWQIDSTKNDVQNIVDLDFAPNGFEAFIGYATRARDFTVGIREPGLLIRGIGFPRAVAIPRDGDTAWIASSMDNGSFDSDPDALFSIDTFTNVVGAPIAIDPDPAALAIRPDGARAYVVSRTQGTLSVVDLDARAVVDVVPVGTEPADIAISEDESEIFVALAGENRVVALSTATLDDGVPGNESSTSVSVGANPRSIVLAPDDTRLFVSELDDDTVSVVDVATLQVMEVYAVGNGPAHLAIHPDGTALYSSDTLTDLGRGLLEAGIATADTTPPRVTDVGPKDRSGQLLQDSPIEIVFRERMDGATVVLGNVDILDEFDVPIPGLLTVGANGVAAVFKPDVSYRYRLNSEVRVRVGTGVTDDSGNAMPEAEEWVVPVIEMQLPNVPSIPVNLSTAGITADGSPGAVHPGSRVEITNLFTDQVFTTTAAADGSFTLRLQGLDTHGYELVTSLFGGRARTEPVSLPVGFTIQLPNPDLVTYEPGPAGTLLAIGAPGAVDPQTIKLEVRNLTQGIVFRTGAIEADGSFAVAVKARPGDVFDLVPTIVGAIILDPVALDRPNPLAPVIDSLDPSRIAFGESVTVSISGANFGLVADNVLLRVAGKPTSNFELDIASGALLLALAPGADTADIQVTVGGQDSNLAKLIVTKPPNTSLFAEDVIDSDVTNDPADALGDRNRRYVDLGDGGEITLELGSTVIDGVGNDFQVFEDTGDGANCYEVFVSASANGPFDSLGVFCGTALVNLAGHTPIRFVRIRDVAGDAGIVRLDAIQAIRVRLQVTLSRVVPVATSVVAGDGLMSRAASFDDSLSVGADEMLAIDGGGVLCAANDQGERGDSEKFIVTTSPPPVQGYYGPKCEDKFTWKLGGTAGNCSESEYGSLSSCDEASTEFLAKHKAGSVNVTVEVQRIGHDGCTGRGSDVAEATITLVNFLPLLDGMEPADSMNPPNEVDGIATDGLAQAGSSPAVEGAILQVRIAGAPGVEWGYENEDGEFAPLPVSGREGRFADAAGATNALGDVPVATKKYVPPVEFDLDGPNPEAVRKVKLAGRVASDASEERICTKEVALVKPPVVLVHGINSDPSYWNNLVDDFEKHRGYKTFAADHSGSCGGLQGNGDIRESYRCVRNKIVYALTAFRTGTAHDKMRIAAKKADIVAHSYGGLLSRWYSEGHGRDENGASDYGDDVRKLITLGTPHKGAPITNMLLAAASNRRIRDAAPNPALEGSVSPAIALLPSIESMLRVAEVKVPMKWTVESMGPHEFDSLPAHQAMSFESQILIALNGTEPFHDDIAYASIVGTDDRVRVYGVPFFNAYRLVDPHIEWPYRVANKSYFPWLRMLDGGISQSDGIVPVWSQALPARSENIGQPFGNHISFLDDRCSWRGGACQIVDGWLQDSTLPRGSQHRSPFLNNPIFQEDSHRNALAGAGVMGGTLYDGGILAGGGINEAAIVKVELSALAGADLNTSTTPPELGSKGGILQVTMTGMAPVQADGQLPKMQVVRDAGFPSFGDEQIDEVSTMASGPGAEVGQLRTVKGIGRIARSEAGSLVGPEASSPNLVDEEEWAIGYEMAGFPAFGQSPPARILFPDYVLPPPVGPGGIPPYTLRVGYPPGEIFTVSGGVNVTEAPGTTQTVRAELVLDDLVNFVLDSKSFSMTVPADAWLPVDDWHPRIIVPYSSDAFRLWRDTETGYIRGPHTTPIDAFSVEVFQELFQPDPILNPIWENPTSESVVVKAGG